MKTKTSLTLFDPVLLKPAIKASFTKLDPRVQWRSPVMFVVYIGSILTTFLGMQALQGAGEAPTGFIFAVALTYVGLIFILALMIFVVGLDVRRLFGH